MAEKITPERRRDIRIRCVDGGPRYREDCGDLLDELEEAEQKMAALEANFTSERKLLVLAVEGWNEEQSKGESLEERQRKIRNAVAAKKVNAVETGEAGDYVYNQAIDDALATIDSILASPLTDAEPNTEERRDTERLDWLTRNMADSERQEPNVKS